MTLNGSIDPSTEDWTAAQIEEVKQVLRDLRGHDCEMITLGQYLQPSPHHLAVTRFVTPAEFDKLREFGYNLGFSHVASGPMVRSSYHADLQAHGQFNDMIT